SAFTVPGAAAAAAKPARTVLAGLETAAKPFASAEGRASSQAGPELTRTFDAGILEQADAAAAVIPGVRAFPRAAGVGLARAYNGVSEEKKADVPTPSKPSEEKPETRGQKILMGVLLALCLAGALGAWYELYASMGQVMQMGEQQIEQSMPGYPGHVPTIGEVFGSMGGR
ncbi:MAG: hypothetical protein KGL53_14235, partial [Elusimicrobia bacterium]|nr:hypothetical protein [Elusimicrobiota bacterium]